MIRKAEIWDIDGVVDIYNRIHRDQEEGRIFVGWIRGLYPTGQTALDALERKDLFVCEEKGKILAAAIINQIQLEVYGEGAWEHPAEEDRVCVLHTLVVDPGVGHKGLGKQFIRFYEDYARENGWEELRLDTNEKNTRARTMYKNAGYKEIGLVPTVFNGIPGVNLVLLEKNLKKS